MTKTKKAPPKPRDFKHALDILPRDCEIVYKEPHIRIFRWVGKLNMSLLVSYESKIVCYDHALGKLYFFKDWDFSRTTGRHRSFYLDFIRSAPLTPKQIRAGIASGKYGTAR